MSKAKTKTKTTKTKTKTVRAQRSDARAPRQEAAGVANVISKNGLKRYTLFLNEDNVNIIRKAVKKSGDAYQTLMRTQIDKLAQRLAA